MPGKTAKSAPLPPFGLSGVTALVRRRHPLLRERGKIAKMHARSGVIREIPAYMRKSLPTDSARWRLAT